MAVIKSPLRYPGGKSKFIPQIMSHMPVNVQDFREPFVGGGSVFIHVRQAFPDAKVWINDLNFDLYCFWKESQKDSCAVAERVEEIKNTVTNGSHLFTQMKEVPDNKTSDFDRAVQYDHENRDPLPCYRLWELPAKILSCQSITTTRTYCIHCCIL